MACGCLCAGFAGFGGWDYMRQADAGGFAPQGYALREVPWEGNGWWVADGDVLGAATGLERALAVLADGSAGSIRKNARRTAQSYDAAGQSAGLEGL
jgi:hypothetical protein